MAPAEEWRPVVGFERAYEVSNLGRVRSLDRRDNRGARVRGRILKPWRAGRLGYAAVYLSCGKAHARYVHHLVLEAFVGPRPPGLEACHNHGDVEDNRLDNLRYDTPVENQRDRVAHGTDQHGERNTQAKLKTVDVLAIRRSTGSQRSVGALFGVSQQTVCKIKNGSRWRHV